MEYLNEKQRRIPIIYSSEIVVLGGGPAGISAAVAASRMGVEVVLIEKESYLGGQATGGLVILLCGLTDGKNQIIKGFCQEVIERLGNANSLKSGPDVIFNPESMKYLFDQYTVENDIKLYFNSLVTGAILDDRKLRYVIIENKSGRFAIEGKYLIDCTGDGDTAKWCNIPFEKPEKEKIRPVTLIFRMANVNIDKAKKYIKENRDDYESLVKQKGHNPNELERWRETINKNEVWFNTVFLGNIDCTNAEDLTYANIKSREKVKEIIEIYKRIPGFENAYIIDTAPLLGVRESRRIIGVYTLTKKDITTEFKDSIARANNTFTKEPKSISIPYRCLIPERVDNLLFAGRCISVYSEIFDLIREIPCCMATGQAAGIASALCFKHDKSSVDVPIDILQDHLRKQNAIF